MIVAGTSQCGACYQCLHGRPDYCQFTFGGDDVPAFAEMRDGTPVFAEAGIDGMSEVMVAYEEYCVPVFTDLPAAELTLLGDQLTSGFAAGQCDMPNDSSRTAGRAAHDARSPALREASGRAGSTPSP